MKRLLAIALACAASAYSQAVKLDASGTHCAGNPCTTSNLTLNTTGATLIIVNINSAASQDPNSSTLNDVNGNTYTKLTSIIDSVSTTIWYSWNHSGSALSVGSSHVFTATGPYMAFAVAAYSGTLFADPFENQVNTHSASASSLAAGPITCTLPNSIIYASMSAHAGSTYTVSGSFSGNLFAQNAFVGSNTSGMGASYIIESGGPTANVSPTWSGLGGSNAATAIACFKSNISASTSTKLRGVVN